MHGQQNPEDQSDVLQFRISSETVPAGGTAQVKLFLENPQPILGGHLEFALGGLPNSESGPPISSAKVFSAAGDVYALSLLRGQLNPLPGLATWFVSPSAGVGRSPDLPVMEFSIEVNQSFSVDMTGEFSGPGGKRYSVTARPGSLTVDGNLSIGSVTPSGSTGILPAGSVVQISGTGFGEAITVDAQDLNVGGVQVRGPTLIEMTLDAATEITGKHLILHNGDTEQIDYWIGLDDSLLTFPLRADSSVTCKNPGPELADPNLLALLNANPVEAEVIVTNAVSAPNPRAETVTVQIPSGGIYQTTILDPADSTFTTDPSTPLRSICFAVTHGFLSLLTWLPIAPNIEQPPFIDWVANAASQNQASVSPGEIITIYGHDVGPADPLHLTLDDSGAITRELGGVRVLFDGIPSPLLFVSRLQVNAVVPYEIPAAGITTLRVDNNRSLSGEWRIPLAPAAPGVFTLDSSGFGPAAVLNQDNSVNSPANPAEPGSVVQVFATGEGLTTPPSATGGIAGDALNSPARPVTATIGGVNASVLWAGSSPGSPSGLLQLNVQVPSSIGAGDAVPLLVRVGSASSLAGPTIAVGE